MLQNEGLDGKKKQYTTCALDSTSPKEGEGGGGGGSRVGYVLAVSPSDTFLKVYFGPTKFYYYF
jgi:hypothetical protein